MGPAGPLERRLVTGLVRMVWRNDRRGGPWEVPGHLDHDDLIVPGNGRLTARYFRQNAQPEGARGVAVLVHPDKRYGQHWFVKEGWVDLLVAAGFDVLTVDLTGYGGSESPSSYYHEDVVSAVETARDRSGGLPVHLIGVSIGSYAAANASPHVELASLMLESPYPTFAAWYGDHPLAAVSNVFRIFRKSWRSIHAPSNVAAARAERILVTATRADAVTPEHLSATVAAAAPADRSHYLVVDDAAHLELFHDARYRQAILEHLGVPAQEAQALVAAPAVGLVEAKGEAAVATA